MLLTLDKKEALRYLGIKSAQADEATLLLVDSVYDEIKGLITPKYHYKIFDIVNTGKSVIIDGIEFKSENLSCCLKDCKKVILFCVTIGVGADTLTRKYSVTDTAKCSVCHAVGAALVETFCDNACCEIAEKHNIKMRPRYSSGYGDLALSTQKEFFELLDITKHLGITLSESYMMTPSKSVTAFIGVK